ncbi:uncharacterized protein LOC134434791 isoform X2 [Engraulis encrasicolus]|uniref:uncharacterized protein LOC134434791 isoform X2 n=1 Tax=Engraulis encrasicolus TaxID=184585 RepID=UPI002FD09931
MLDSMLKSLNHQRGLKLKLIIVFLFAGLEHLMDVVFVCPCDPTWNALASALFFTLPATIIFLLMLVMQCSPQQPENGEGSDDAPSEQEEADEQTSLLPGHTSVNYSGTPAVIHRLEQREGCCEKVKKGMLTVVMALAVPMLWVMMMFFEGQFYVCARTNWSGRFVKLNDTYEHMWCKPDQSSSRTDKIKRSIGYYVESQWVGLVLLSALMLYVFIYTINECCKRQRNRIQQNA